MHIGIRIRQARREAGLEQAQLAEAVGVAANTVWKWESQLSAPRAAMIERVAEALGKSVGWLLSGEGDERAEVTIGGVAVSGPSETLAAIVSGLQERQGADAQVRAQPAMVERRRPNERHTGIYEALDLLERDELKARTGLELTAEEELSLRTYGRSGPAVDTLDEAVRVVLQWRSWGRPTPANDGPEPGVAALLADKARMDALGITDDETEALRAIRWQGRVQTADDAALLVTYARAVESTAWARQQADSVRVPADEDHATRRTD